MEKLRLKLQMIHSRTQIIKDGPQKETWTFLPPVWFSENSSITTRGSNNIHKPFGNINVLHTDLKFTEMEF